MMSGYTTILMAHGVRKERDMSEIIITLDAQDNAGSILLNRMVESNMDISNMVSLVSGIIHSSDTGSPLDSSDKLELKELGYDSAALIETFRDYRAMHLLMTYLDEELPGILKTKN